MATSFQETLNDVLLRAFDAIAENSDEYQKNSDIPKQFAGFVPIMKDAITPNVGGFCSCDVLEDESFITVLCDVPGVKKEDIKLDLTKQMKDYVLCFTVSRTVNSQMKPKKKERYSGVKSREVHLPFNIDPSSIKAKTEDGVLQVVISKMKGEHSTLNIPIS